MLAARSTHANDAPPPSCNQCTNDANNAEPISLISLPQDLWEMIVKSFVCKGDHRAITHVCHTLLQRMGEVIGECTFPRIHLSSYARVQWVKAMRFGKSALQVVSDTQSVMEECARRGDVDLFMFLIHYCSYLDWNHITPTNKFSFVLDLVESEHQFLLEHLLFGVTGCADELYPIIANTAAAFSKPLVLKWLHRTLALDESLYVIDDNNFITDKATQVFGSASFILQTLSHTVSTSTPPFSCLEWLYHLHFLNKYTWHHLKTHSRLFWLMDPRNRCYETHQLKRWLVRHDFMDASWYFSAFHYSDVAMARFLNLKGFQYKLDDGGYFLQSRGFDIAPNLNNTESIDKSIDESDPELFRRVSEWMWRDKQVVVG